MLRSGVGTVPCTDELSSDAISGTGLHPCGSILATCSGQRYLSNFAHNTPDNSVDRKDEDEVKTESDDGDASSSTQSIPSPHSHQFHASASSPDSSTSSPVGRRGDNSLKIWAW